jgi:arylformamidase
MTPSPDRRVWDISRPVGPATAGWPGDVPYSFRLSWRKAAGASVNVGAIAGSVHTATHCDAPFHFDDAGATVERLPPELFLGPAIVVDIRGADSWQSRLEGLDLSATPRVLFRTGGWPETARFPDSIPVMERRLPAWLADRGVRLIGVDGPSVDELDSKTLDNHHALGRAGITIVEGLWLDDVPPGVYEFVGLPLKLIGADGSPLRAVLREMEERRE